MRTRPIYHTVDDCNGELPLSCGGCAWAHAVAHQRTLDEEIAKRYASEVEGASKTSDFYKGARDAGLQLAKRIKEAR